MPSKRRLWKGERKGIQEEREEHLEGRDKKRKSKVSKKNSMEDSSDCQEK